MIEATTCLKDKVFKPTSGQLLICDAVVVIIPYCTSVPPPPECCIPTDILWFKVGPNFFFLLQGVFAGFLWFFFFLKRVSFDSMCSFGGIFLCTHV